KEDWLNLKYRNPKIDAARILDLASKAGFKYDNQVIKKIVNTLIEIQRVNGSWLNDPWLTYSITISMKRLGVEI
ncbi:MAG: hypothetical protein ACTSYQ_00960, partial [Candidatus Odinarchaeia archaeon]